MPRQKFKDTINNWLESTSLRQLRNLPRARNNFWKFFWAGIFATTLGIGIWQATIIVKNYLQYNKDTIVVFENAYNTPFPAVTICNLNPMRKSVGNYIQELKDLMTAYRYLVSIANANTPLTYNSKGQVIVAPNTTTQNDSAIQDRVKRSIENEFSYRVKRSTDITITLMVAPGADQSQCVVTTTTTMLSTTTTSEEPTSTMEATSTELSTPIPTTDAPTTEVPTTMAPTTEAETTKSPTTEAPTDAPTTVAALTTPQTTAASTMIQTTAATTTLATTRASTTAPLTSTAQQTTLQVATTTNPVTTTVNQLTTTGAATTASNPSTTGATTAASSTAAVTTTRASSSATTALTSSPTTNSQTTALTTGGATTSATSPSATSIASSAATTNAATTNAATTGQQTTQASTAPLTSALSTTNQATAASTSANTAATTAASATTAGTTKPSSAATTSSIISTTKPSSTAASLASTSGLFSTTTLISSATNTSTAATSATVKTSTVNNNFPTTRFDSDADNSGTTKNLNHQTTDSSSDEDFTPILTTEFALIGQTTLNPDNDGLTTKNSNIFTTVSFNNGDLTTKNSNDDASLQTTISNGLQGSTSSDTDLSTNSNTEITPFGNDITPTSDNGGGDGSGSGDGNNGSGSGDNNQGEGSGGNNGNGSGDGDGSDGSGDNSGDGSGDNDGSDGSGSGDDDNNGNGSGDGENGGSGDNNNGSGDDDGSGSGIDNGNGNGSGDSGDDGDGSEGDNDGSGIDNGNGSGSGDGDGNGSGDNDGGSGDGNGNGDGDGDGDNNGSGDGSGNGNEGDSDGSGSGDNDGNGNGSGDDDGNGENGNGNQGNNNNSSNTPITTIVTLTPRNTAYYYSSTDSSNDNSRTTDLNSNNNGSSTDNFGNLTTPSNTNNFSSNPNGNNGGFATTSPNNNRFSTTLSDLTNPQSNFSTTNSNNAFTTPNSYGSTTRDPIVFDGYTQKELDQLIDKYQLSTTASRVALESQTQDRMLSIVNDNINASYTLRDILISCAYNMVPCDYENDFEIVADPDYGNCYTFNYNAKHTIVRAGSDYGLKMIAFSNISEYLETSSKSGMRVVVHKQDFAPFPNTEGINAAVGTYININVQYNDIQRLGKPYGDCHPANDTSQYIYDGFYTYEGCFRTCYQQQIIDTCNCADPRFPRPRGSTISWCAVANATLFTCYENYLSTYGDFSNVSNCECHTGCTEPEYTLEVSSAIWPGNITNYTTPMCWGYYPNTNIDCYTAYKENAVFIDVSFNRMIVERTSERPSVSSMNLFHQISGAVALWTGVSMLIFAEMIEVLWFGIFRPNVSPRVGSTDKISDMSNPKQNIDGIYDSNMASEYANDVPQPFASNAAGNGMVAGIPSQDYMPKDFENPEFTSASHVEPKFCFD